MAESISSRVAWKLRKVISGGSRDAPSRTGIATVQRRDADGTVWVRFPGSSIDTPVTGAVVANVAAGDTISYDLSGGRVSVTGNASDPSAGTNTVRAVRKAAESARKVAGKAQDIADAIGQHFWADDNGAHVSTEKDNPTGERNILMNSLGILLRQGSSWLASFSDSAVAFYDGLGNTASNVVAQFGADGAVIGRSGESHMELDYHSLRMIDREGAEYLHISDLRDADGYFTDEFSGNGSTVQFPLSVIPIANTISVTVDGVASTNWYYTTPFLTFTAAPSDGAVILVKYQPSDNDKSLLKAFTYGTRRIAHHIGPYSFAAGHDVSAWSMGSVAFGLRTRASSNYAFAEGCDTKASGIYSHAQNHNTTAAYEAQTAIGKYNANNSANAFEIGNGTSSNRSNAFTVAWDGTVTAAGEVTGASVAANVTLASGVSATTHTVKRSGNLATVYIDGMNLASELANHGTATVATVPSGYRPAYTAYVQLVGWNQGGSYATVGTNGSVTVSNQSGAAIPTARSLGLTLTYVM